MMRIITISKFFCWIDIVLIGAILILGYLNKSCFEIICAVCAALFWTVHFRLSLVLDKDENTQKKLCKPVGFFLLLPAMGMLAAGIFIAFRPYTGRLLQITYCVIALSAALSICLLIQIANLWKAGSLAGRFLRLAIFAAISVPLSLIIVLALHVAQSDGAAVLSCMSTVIFAGVASLFAVNLIMVSICGHKSTADSVKTISALINSKKLIFARVSILKDALLVTGKLIISIISLSFFMFANALYSTGMGIARFIAVRMHTQDRESFANALSGVVFGGLATLTGLYVIFRSFSHKKLSAPRQPF